MQNQTVISLHYPTPKWAKYVVRLSCWLTGAFAVMGWQYLPHMAIGTAVLSVISLFIGEKHKPVYP